MHQRGHFVALVRVYLLIDLTLFYQDNRYTFAGNTIREMHTVVPPVSVEGAPQQSYHGTLFA